ncbi:MAG TPA: hypothetical protein VHB77_01990 [Planctomycetaceae bacterium]|nr:hypothetical protein [Planctomycetaceae bacterium]
MPRNEATPKSSSSKSFFAPVTRRVQAFCKSGLMAAGILAVSCGLLFLAADRLVVVPSRGTLEWLSPSRPRPSGFRGLGQEVVRPQIVLALPTWAAAVMLSVGAITTVSAFAARGNR